MRPRPKTLSCCQRGVPFLLVVSGTCSHARIQQSDFCLARMLNLSFRSPTRLFRPAEASSARHVLQSWAVIDVRLASDAAHARVCSSRTLA